MVGMGFKPDFNPLLLSAHKSARISKISILKIEGTIIIK